MAQITGTNNLTKASTGIYWSNATQCRAANPGAECRPPWWFFLAVAAAALTGGVKRVRRIRAARRARR